MDYVLSFIGGAATVGIIVRFCSNWISSCLSQRYENKLQIQLEAYKTQLNRRQYVSKVRFDVEFSIYRELSRTVLYMVEDCRMLFAQLDIRPKEKDAQIALFHERFKKAVASSNTATSVIMENAPFISENFYNKFMILRGKCCVLLGDAEDCRCTEEGRNYLASHRDLLRELYEKTKEIDSLRDSLMGELREYLKQLDVER